MAPSAIAIQGDGVYDTNDVKQEHEVPRALHLNEIDDVIQSYVDAALRCVKAGFDFIEIHSANGYLLDQVRNARTFISDAISLTFDLLLNSFCKALVTIALMNTVGASRTVPGFSWKSWTGYHGMILTSGYNYRRWCFVIVAVWISKKSTHVATHASLYPITIALPSLLCL